MKHNEEYVRKIIQAIGDDAFPDDQVTWTVTNITTKNEYAFTEVMPCPNTVGYEKYVFVLKAETHDSYALTSYFVWADDKWDLLFTDSSETDEWRSLLASI